MAEQIEFSISASLGDHCGENAFYRPKKDIRVFSAKGVYFLFGVHFGGEQNVLQNAVTESGDPLFGGKQGLQRQFMSLWGD